MSLRWKFWYQRSISWPDFLIENDISAISWRCLLIFALDKRNVRHYFYFRSSWPTVLENASRVSHLTVKFLTKFVVDIVIRYPVIAFLLLIRYVTLRPLPFTLINGHTWRVTWSTPSLKVLRLSVRVTSSDISHKIPLTMCLQLCSHCACDVSRDLHWGQIFSTYLKSLTPIWLFTMQLLRYTLQWRLRAVYSVHVECCLSCIRAKKILSTVDIGPPNGVFGERGVVNVKFLVLADTKKAHPCAESRLWCTKSRMRGNETKPRIRL